MTYPQDISQFGSCSPLRSSSSFCILSYRGGFKSPSNTTLSFWSLGFCLGCLLCLYYLASVLTEVLFLHDSICHLTLKVPVERSGPHLRTQGQHLSFTVLSILSILAQWQTFRRFPTGLPWWLCCKKSACQCRRQAFDPWSGKIPHTVEQLSLWSTNTEPVLWSLVATTSESTCLSYWSLQLLELCPATREATTTRSLCTITREEALFATTRKKPAQQHRPSLAK